MIGGFGALGRDPIGVLLPTAGVLLLQLGVAVAIRNAWGASDPRALVLTVLGVFTAFPVLTSPLRAGVIAAGARALGRPARGLWTAPALVVVEAVVLGLAAVAGVLVAAPFVAIAMASLSRGVPIAAALATGAGALTAATAVLLVRASFAYAAAEAVIGRKGPLRALAAGWRASGPDRLALVGILLVGDLTLALGGALCGAGALPGYPVGDLMVVHRWLSIPSAPSRP